VVPMQTMRNLGVDPERVNVNGGAIALGHPLGATGAMILGTAIDELERRGLGTALITLCIGGGQAVATIFERVCEGVVRRMAKAQIDQPFLLFYPFCFPFAFFKSNHKCHSGITNFLSLGFSLCNLRVHRLLTLDIAKPCS